MEKKNYVLAQNPPIFVVFFPARRVSWGRGWKKELFDSTSPEVTTIPLRGAKHMFPEKISRLIFVGLFLLWLDDSSHDARLSAVSTWFTRGKRVGEKRSGTDSSALRNVL